MASFGHAILSVCALRGFLYAGVKWSSSPCELWILQWNILVIICFWYLFLSVLD